MAAPAGFSQATLIQIYGGCPLDYQVITTVKSVGKGKQGALDIEVKRLIGA